MKGYLNDKHPVWARGFRPFFLLGALYCGLFNLAAGSHWFESNSFIAAHESLFGALSAMMIGFLLTAVPRWSDSSAKKGKHLAWLVLLWIGARLAPWLAELIGPLPMVLLNLGTTLLLIVFVARPLTSEASRNHRGFLFYLIAILLCQAWVYMNWINGLSNAADQGLTLLIGLMLMCQISCMGRVSIAVANNAQARSHQPSQPYQASPHKRRVVILCLTLMFVCQATLPGSSVAAWLALASATAIFSMLQIWHIRTLVCDAYGQLLYLIHLSLGLWLASMGLPVLMGEINYFNVTGHGLSALLPIVQLVMMLVVTQRHTGRPLDYRLGILLPPFIALVSLWASLFKLVPSSLPQLVVSLSMIGFLIHFGKSLQTPRVDDQPG